MSEDKKGRVVRDYLNDILENIKDINVFIADIDYDDLKSDKKTQYAVIRCLEISDHQQSWGFEAGPSKGPGPRSAGGR